jgi:general secretion pathway protein G
MLITRYSFKARTSHRTRVSRRARGVTLIEILIVLAIIALIAGGVAAVAIPELAKARIKTAKVDVQALHPIAAHYRDDHIDECPTAAQLKTARLVSGSVTDPWGAPYHVDCQADDVTVRSDGPDRTPGTVDDIVAPSDAPPRGP